jgi:hypothetical protein
MHSMTQNGDGVPGAWRGDLTIGGLWGRIRQFRHLPFRRGDVVWSTMA